MPGEVRRAVFKGLEVRKSKQEGEQRMTPEEAIKYLTITRVCAEDTTAGKLQEQMCDVAIEAIKEVQKYRVIENATIIEIAEVLKEFSEIGTVEECREAVKRHKANDNELGDLISRKALLEETKIAFDEAIGADVTVFLDLIKEQPTAFDAEKVIEELEDSKFWVASEIKDGDGFVEDYYNQEVIDIEKATEIVEKGGL